MYKLEAKPNSMIEYRVDKRVVITSICVFQHKIMGEWAGYIC